MKKRHPFLFLEMIIAFVLMGSVIAMLFTGFYDAIKAKNKVKIEKEHVLTLERLRLRFGILFKSTIDFKKISEAEYYLKYHGGIDPNPNFRSEIEAVLRIKDRTLSLISWAEKGNPRKEVLCEDIESIKFEFFDEKKGTFFPEYPSKKPFMIKIKINKTEELPLFL